MRALRKNNLISNRISIRIGHAPVSGKLPPDPGTLQPRGASTNIARFQSLGDLSCRVAGIEVRIAETGGQPMTAETRKAALGVIAVLVVLASPLAVIFLAGNSSDSQDAPPDTNVGQMAAAERLEAACQAVQALNIKMQGFQAGHHGTLRLRPELRDLSALTCGE